MRQILSGRRHPRGWDSGLGSKPRPGPRLQRFHRRHRLPRPRGPPGGPRLHHRHRPAGDRGPPVHDLADLIATVPGLTVVQAGSPGQQTSLFPRGADSDQTLLLWNGIQLNDPYFGGANWQFVPSDGVSRVEVVRGPGERALRQQRGGRRGAGDHRRASSGASVRLEGGENGYKRAGARRRRRRSAPSTSTSPATCGGATANSERRFDSEDLSARAPWSLAPAIEPGRPRPRQRLGDRHPASPAARRPRTAESPGRSARWPSPSTSSAAAGRSTPSSRGSDFDNAYRDPADPFGFTASDTESEALRGRTVASWQAGTTSASPSAPRASASR